MKRTSLFASALLLLGLVFLTTGCSTLSNEAKGPPTYALIATVNGGGMPTDAQWASMQQKFAALLAASGRVLVTDPSKATKLIQVLFVPDLNDPSTGVSYVVAVRDNPGSLIAKAPRTIPAGFSSSYSTTGFNPFDPRVQYYGYFDDYSNNGGGYTTTPNNPSTNPPGHTGGHHVTHPVDCPPEPPHHTSPGGYAGNGSSHSNPPGDGGHWWNRGSSSDSSYSSGSSSSHSSPSYSSSSDYSGPSTSYSSAASSSAPSISFSSPAPSYSPPAESSSSSSSSSSSPSQPEKP